nr:MAG TPA: HNH endonuclease [Caudoviricetes sp.]
MAKDKDYQELIRKVEWVKLRRQKLSMQPLCERCQKEGKVTAATEVHHIVPVECGLSREEKRRLMYNPSNLMSLCHACHVKTHTEMGRSGKEQSKQRTREHLERFKKKFIT